MGFENPVRALVLLYGLFELRVAKGYSFSRFQGYIQFGDVIPAWNFECTDAVIIDRYSLA
jgi:hypothetical protein